MTNADRQARARPRHRAETLLVLLVTAAAAWQLLVREAYHRGAGELPGMLAVLVAGLTLLGALAATARNDGSPKARVLARGIVVLAIFNALFQLGAFPGLQGWGQHPRAWQWAGLAAGFMGVVLIASRLSAQTWRYACQALAVATLAWVITPHGLALVRSPAIAWPAGAAPQDAERDRGRVATIVLLLDEMNGKDGGVVADELARAGLAVSRTAVPSVGPNTRNVLATLFHGETFLGAQPCGFTALCTDSLALDFSRVRASRPDIDIVGIAHPYCAIEGLRHCVRQTEPLIAISTDKLRCSLFRRFGLAWGVDELRCRELYMAGFARSNEANLQQIRKAPALTQGGVLFAHVLLPHPPGIDPKGSLESHYRDNLELSRQLVAELIRIAGAAQVETRWVVFSDHPLRQSLWCSSFAPYIWDGCVPQPHLDDTTVPVITASRSGLDVQALQSNRDVFSLIAKFAP